MSWHTNNTYCSVTVVKLAEYNGDDLFLLLMLKQAGGLEDPLSYHFLQGKDRSRQSIMSNCSGYAWNHFYFI